MSFFDVTLFATAFATLTVIMDPIGTVPVFLGLTSRYAPLKQRRAAIQATSVSFGVIVTFAILGGQILHLLHISVEALQLSGARRAATRGHGWPSWWRSSWRTW